MRSRMLPTILFTSATGLILTACTGAPEDDTAATTSADDHFPVTVESCGNETTLTTAPENVVTMNQGATEVVLALGLADQLAGTAYLDDTIPDKWASDYEAVPVLSDEYPSKEDLLAAEPDFVYASYASAFDAKVAGTHSELEEAGIGSYLSPFACDDSDLRPDPSFDAVWSEVEAVADALGAPEAAEQLRSDQQHTLDQLADDAVGDGLTALWYDSGTKTPYVGAGGGGPQLILDAVGATNIFADLDDGWADGNWEDVLAADPDVIVLADASWDAASDKRTYLENDEVLGRLTAVQEERFITIPFSATTPGVRLADGAQEVANQITELDLDE